MKALKPLTELSVAGGILHSLELLQLPQGIAAVMGVLVLSRIVGRIRRNAREMRERTLRTRKPTRDTFGQTLGWSATYSALGTLLGLAILSGGVWLTDTIRGIDSDRPRIERQLADFAKNEKWEAIIGLIDDRLQREASSDWKSMLRQRQQQAFVHAAYQHQQDDRHTWLARAVEHADRHQLDSFIGRLLLGFGEQSDFLQTQLQGAIQALDDTRKARSDDQVEFHQQLEAVRERIGALSAERQASDAKHQDDRRQWDQRQLATLLDWSEDLSVFPERKLKRLIAAQAFAMQNGLGTDEVEARLDVARRAWAALQPVQLPEGTTATLRSVSMDIAPPAMVVELSIVDREGRPIRGLERKDFSIGGERSPFPTHTVSEVVPATVRVQLALALDVSGSMKGAALAAAKAGAQSLIRKLAAQADFRLLSFGDTVRDLTEWTSDPEAACGSLASLQADGGTALLRGVERASGLVADRPGPKAVVLFTDGRDSEGGADIGQIVNRCRTEQIAVHVIALERPELDRPSIDNLTAPTGGMFVTASHEEELAQLFLRVADNLTAPRYRLAVLNHDQSEPLQIRIGGERHVDMRILPEEVSRLAGF